jgi:hypothetical protein
LSNFGHYEVSPNDGFDDQILNALPDLGGVNSLSLHVVPQRLQAPENPYKKKLVPSYFPPPF